MTAKRTKAQGAKSPKKAPAVNGAKLPKTATKAPERSSARVQEIVTLLKLVTAPSRQTILLLLVDGERNVGEICGGLESTSQPAVSHQLSLLRHGKLIEAIRNGRNVYYQLTDAGRSVAKAFLTLADSPHR